MSVSQRPDNPGVRIPPPFIFLFFFLAGLSLRRWLPAPFMSRPAGLIFLLLAVAMGGWGLLVMLRAKTGIVPHHPATALITSGPFRFSRNPLYISMILGYLSATVWIGSLPSLLLLPVAILVLRQSVIRREEAYLTRRFGEEYRAYCSRVRRWI